MTAFKRILALSLAVIFCFALASCGAKSGNKGGEKESESLYEGEDLGVEKSSVNVANTTGKDAVKLIVKKASGNEWSDNLLNEDYLHNGKAVPVYYPVTDDNVYDIRLYFEDGSYEEIAGVDFAAQSSYIFVGDKPAK